MAWAEYQVVPGQALTEQNLDFTPATVITENPSSSPIYYVNIARWCPPFARTVRRWQVAPGQNIGRVVQYRADTLPAGAQPMTPTVTENMRVVFTDEVLPERQDAFGLGAPINPFNPQTTLTLGTVAYVQGAAVITNFILSPGALSVGWDTGAPVMDRPVTQPNYELKVVGHQSATVYVDTKFDPTQTRVQGTAVLNAADTSVDVSYFGPQGDPFSHLKATITDIIPSLSVVQTIAAPAPNTAGLLTNVAVGNTNPANALPGAPLANRKAVRVTNPPTATQDIYVGYSNAVLAAAPVAGQAQGVRIAPGQSWTFTVGPAILLYGIVAAGAGVAQVEEVA